MKLDVQNTQVCLRWMNKKRIKDVTRNEGLPNMLEAPSIKNN